MLCRHFLQFYLPNHNLNHLYWSTKKVCMVGRLFSALKFLLDVTAQFNKGNVLLKISDN